MNLIAYGMTALVTTFQIPQAENVAISIKGVNLYNPKYMQYCIAHNPNLSTSFDLPQIQFATNLSNTNIDPSDVDFDFRPNLVIKKVRGHIKYIKKLTPKFDFD